MSRASSVALGAAMVVANIALMVVLAGTPVADVVRMLFGTLILGVLVFGAVLTAGTALADRGVRREAFGMALLGVALLQVGYGAFGAFILSMVPAGQRLLVSAIAAVVTGGIAAVLGLYVFGTGRDVRWCRRYASYAFLGVFGIALVGTFVPVLAVLGFFLALTGFVLYLAYEIGELERRPGRTVLNGVGLYSAFMGVFVHVLRLVAMLYADRR